MDVDDPAPMDNDDLTSLQAHLSRRSHIADLFHKADARATLALAEKARKRIVVTTEVGMMVYYFRRDKGTR